MELMTHYRDNADLRNSFNALAQDTFGLNFEWWYQRGFWTDCYQPYSMVEEGQVVANVSVNRTDFLFAGKVYPVIQLGTVMTRPEYRNRGLIRRIMARIRRDWADVAGVYLFANDSVVEFYPKFGFRRGREMVYERDVHPAAPKSMVPVAMTGPEGWQGLSRAMEQGEPCSRWAMVDNPGLVFFYAAQFMQDCVCRSPDGRIWAIAQQEGGTLTLHNVFAPQDVTLEQVIECFGPEVERVQLGFAPKDPAGWETRVLAEEDCTFFVQGELFDRFQTEQLRIPSLSHA